MLRRARELNFFRKQNECKLKAWGGSYAALPPDGGSSYSAICTRRVVGTKLCLGLPGEKVPPGLGRGCTKQSWTRALTVALTVAHCPNKQKKKLVQKLSDGQCCSGKQEKVFPVSGCASKTDDHSTVWSISSPISRFYPL